MHGGFAATDKKIPCDHASSWVRKGPSRFKLTKLPRGHACTSTRGLVLQSGSTGRKLAFERRYAQCHLVDSDIIDIFTFLLGFQICHGSLCSSSASGCRRCRRRHSRIPLPSRDRNRRDRNRPAQSASLPCCTLPLYRSSVHWRLWRPIAHRPNIFAIQPSLCTFPPSIEQPAVIFAKRKIISSTLFSLFEFRTFRRKSICISMTPFAHPCVHCIPQHWRRHMKPCAVIRNGRTARYAACANMPLGLYHKSISNRDAPFFPRKSQPVRPLRAVDPHLNAGARMMQQSTILISPTNRKLFEFVSTAPDRQ